MTTNATGLLGNGNAIVIGLPRNFSLSHALRKATRIRLATAFAHMSGWEVLAQEVRRTTARVDLLSGLDFCQTEPNVLREWLRLSRTGRVKAYLSRKSPPTFHPKVLIVESRNRVFAIVGSGNLSAGGLRDNIECSLYSDSPSVTQQLNNWLDVHIQYSEEITPSVIEEYEPKYTAALKARKTVRAKQEEAEARIASSTENRRLNWTDAVKRAKRYFASKKFKQNDRRQWTSSAKKIRRLLHYPSFNFNSNEWAEFFKVYELGNLVPIYSKQLFRRRMVLQKGLRLLVNEVVPIHERINTLLDSRQPVALRGLGINLLTKILVAHRPNKWPVFNGPVGDVLKNFGYEQPRGSERGEKYAAFAHRMKKFMLETGAPDMIALDCFFYGQSEAQKN